MDDDVSYVKYQCFYGLNFGIVLEYIKYRIKMISITRLRK